MKTPFKKGDEVYASSYPEIGFAPLIVIEAFPTGVIAKHPDFDRKYILPNRELTVVTETRRNFLEALQTMKENVKTRESELFIQPVD